MLKVKVKVKVSEETRQDKAREDIDKIEEKQYTIKMRYVSAQEWRAQ